MENENYNLLDEIEDVNQIKQAVLMKVAEYGFDGTLDEKCNEIPFELTDPVKPRFRCCVYREREIMRQRVRMAMGRLPEHLHYKKTDNTQIVHVISAACEGCPLDRFTVTSNCHNCIAHKCIKACKFGAITRTPNGAFIDKTKCKKCGACAKACPYGAILDMERPCKRACPVDAVTMDDNDLALIDEKKCINCGQCVLGCPFGAISDVSLMTNVINSLRSENKTYAMVAPAIEGQFGTASVKAIKAAVKALGFYDVYEAALGADAVAWREAEELIKNKEEGKKMTTSCCPAFVNLVKKHFPTVADNVSTMVSPMVAAARLIQKKDPHADIVFIGPCIAKKNEVVSQYLGEINAAITFEELKVMFRVKGINPEDFEDANEDATLYGKGFARSGGVSAAVMKVIEEKGVDTSIFKACKCSGAAECKKALTLLKVGRLPEDIIEGMACEGGCVNGPGKIQDLPVSKKVFDKYADNQNTEIIANSTEKGMAELNIHRH